MSGARYDDHQDHVLRRLFRAGKSDAEIASALGKLGRSCGAEAIRKRRRVLGLKKTPTYERWTWSPTFAECRA